MTEIRFEGFPPEALRFFRGLKKNNDKSWFELHRRDYVKFVQYPAREFIVEMGDRLKRLSPDVKADPRVNKSLFRIYRDTRFTRDKKPFKEHLGIWFWQGSGKRMRSPGYYFHLEPEQLVLAVGSYAIPKDKLETYRKAVADDALGPELKRIVARMIKKGYGIGGQNYKRVPRGYDKDHPRAELLKHNGIYVFTDVKPPEETHSRKLLDWSFKHYKAMAPMQEWVVKALKVK